MALIDIVRRLFDRGEHLAPDVQEHLRDCASVDKDRLAKYQLYEEMYDGKQRTILLSRARLILEAAGVPFAENVCNTVVDKAARRLKVQSFEVEGRDDVSEWLTNSWWGRTSMATTAATVHTQTPKLGDGFLIVGFDTEIGMATACWNSPRRIKAVYGDDGETMEYAVKTWSTTDPQLGLITRMNIYRADRVEKWYTPTAGENATWLPYAGQGEQHVIAWTESQQLPADGSQAEDALGLPVIHFRNQAAGRIYGRSDLLDVIPFQLEINKYAVDAFDIADLQAWPQRWGTGISDATALRVAIGEIVTTGAEGARFGQWEAADLKPMRENIEGVMRRLSAATDTPMFDLNLGEMPSGEAMKTAESAAVGKAQDRQLFHGPEWSKTGRLAWRLQAVFGEGAPEFDGMAHIKTVWDSAETRNELIEAQTLESLQRLGLSKRTALRIAGFDPDQEAEWRAEEARSALDAAQAAFDRGNVQ